jgi:hypothetical protein
MTWLLKKNDQVIEKIDQVPNFSDRLLKLEPRALFGAKSFSWTFPLFPAFLVGSFVQKSKLVTKVCSVEL